MASAGSKKSSFQAIKERLFGRRKKKKKVIQLLPPSLPPPVVEVKMYVFCSPAIIHCPLPICQLFRLYVDLSADASCVRLITVYVPLVETALKKSLRPFTSSSVATSTASIA
jgi:hypothetical protein